MTKVLIALTGATEWSLKDGSKHFGGVWSPEFVFPHDSFTKAGYEVVVATLGGVPATVDPASLSLGLQENDPASVDFQRSYLRRVAALARPARLEELDPDEFDVIFVPGGFGVFQDLGDNPVIGKMLAKAHRQQGKIVGAVCSGVSALLGARAEDGSWPFAGKADDRISKHRNDRFRRRAGRALASRGTADASRCEVYSRSEAQGCCRRRRQPDYRAERGIRKANRARHHQSGQCGCAQVKMQSASVLVPRQTLRLRGRSRAGPSHYQRLDHGHLA